MTSNNSDCLSAAPETMAQITNPPAPFPSQINLLTATIQELQGHLSSGLITSERLTEEYLNRIDRNNYKGLMLRAVLDVAPRDKVLKIAKEYDDMRAKGIYLGGLHGIPLLVKDNIATDPALGMFTTAGSHALVNSIPKGDAPVVARLRSKGAIILGKANLTEFANYKGDIPAGFSSLGGQTQSAYGPGSFLGDICVSGSSSGSAVGVSAGFAAGAIGTETQGSIVAPSSRAALYGIKASVGLIPRRGIAPLSTTADSVGPMAKSAYDAALLLGAMTGCDTNDSATETACKHIRDDYIQFTKGSSGSFSGKRLGVPRAIFYEHQFWTNWGSSLSTDPLAGSKGRHMRGDEAVPDRLNRVKQSLQDAISRMRALGAVIVDPADINFQPHIDLGMQALKSVYATEFKQGIAMYLGDMASTEVKNLQDIIDFNESHADFAFGPEGKEAGQEKLRAAQLTTGMESHECIEAIKTLRKISADGMEKLLDDLNLDALVIPSFCRVSPAPACIAGSPIATVPMGRLANGEPYGLSFLGRKWSEPTLIGLMAAYEANFPPRAVPLVSELAMKATDIATE